MRHLLTLAILLIAISSFSQAPQGINYQAVAHDNSGEPLSGQTITVRIGILSSSASGTLEWEETHSVSTNSYGLFDLVVGMGSSTGGGNQANFSDINWGGTSHFIRVEIDGGSGFEAIGTTQLLSVPYALHAKTVENDQVDDADADATNELITGGTLNGTDLEITDAGGTTTIDMSSLSGGSGDDWGAQVVESDATLNGDGTTTSPLSVNGDLTDDQTLNYTPATQALDISGGNSVTLSVDDADADPNNELITGGSLSGTDLIITDAGGSTTIDLSPLNSSDTLPIIKDLITGSYVHANTGQSVEIGFSNTPYYTLDSNNRMTLGSNNGSLFVGSTPGGSNLTTGAANFGFGDGALQNVSTGYFNTAIAPVTLNSLTTGAENVAIGRGALSTITDGSGNIAFGYYALGEAGLGTQDNVAIGTNAGSNWTGGYQNVFIGYRAGAMVGTGAGNGNIKIGSNAGINDSGDGKLYIGGHNGTTSLIYGNMLSDSLIINGSLSIGNEYTFPLNDGTNGQVLSTNGLGQTSWVNAGSADEITDADNDTKIQVEESVDEDLIRFDIAGTEIMHLDARTLHLSDGATNINVGINAGISTTTGIENASFGYESLNFNTSGFENTAIGNRTLRQNTTGILNTALGASALTNNSTGNSNTAIGRSALRDVNGSGNTALGEAAGVQVLSGNNNTYIGNESAESKTSGSNNVFLGMGTGYNNTTGNGNVFLGYNAGRDESGSNKLYIENTNSPTPLIYGNFTNDSVRINGSLSVGNEYTFPLTDGNPGEILSTDGAGNTSWQNISAGDFFANGSVTMTGNFQTGGTFISNDGDNEGIQVSNTGLVTLTPATTGAGNYALLTSGDIRTTGQGTGLHLTNNQIKITGNNGNAGNMHFYTGNTERMRIHAGGNVEVYNRTQTNTLTVSSGAGTAGNVLTDDGTGNAVWTLPSGDNDWTSGTNVIYNVTDSVGIGTFSPNTKLEVFGSSNETNLYTFNGSPSSTIAIHNDNLTNSNYSSLSFTTRASNNGTYNSARIVAVNQNHTAGSMSSDLVFMTREAANITEAMRITGENRVGIGTTAPSTDLHLNGDMRIQNGTEGAGRVLTSDAAGNATWKPKSVAFYAGMAPAGGTQTVSQNVQTTLVFQSGTSPFALNDGGGYNNASGQFQAPVAGVYQFNVNVITAGSPSGYFKLNLVHSSGNHIAEKNGFFNTITQNWNSETINVTVHLNAGESVWVEMYNTNGGASFYRDQSSFSGHLVYAD